MKIRTGFVSNSSSSSFILKNKNISIDMFVEDLIYFWQKLFHKNPEIIMIDESVFRFIKVNKNSKKEIMQMYEDQYWGANHQIDYEYSNPYRFFRNFNSFIIDKFCRWIANKFKKTYLQEAMEADIFGTSDDNAIPYEVLEELKKKYGKSLVIHHLG